MLVRCRQKSLVPLIEKGSCEDPNDSEMLDRWANLLASASLKIAVQPRFVGILGELAGSQAQCIEHIAFNDFERFAYPGRDFESSYLEYGEHDSARECERSIQTALKQHKDPSRTIDRLVTRLTRPGLFLELAMIHDSDNDDWYSYDSVHETGVRRESDFSVLESLGLVRRVIIKFEAALKSSKRRKLSVFICYY